MQITENRAELGSIEVRWLQAGDAPVLYLHGVPNGASLWTPFLERTGGVAPDLPGFGDSAKPAELDHSIAGYGRFVEAFADAAGLERLSLVVHDWGVVGLDFAQRHPERIERLVVIAGVPLLPGYRWHKVARAWRTPIIGEMTMGFTTRYAFRREIPEPEADRAWKDFDHGTQRAILKLYRSAPEHLLAQAGARLDAITAPALVIGAEHDPYIPPKFAQAYADALGGPATTETVDAGHWAWLERPELVDRVVAFLASPGAPS